jgi:hypothetical protein
MAGRPESVVGRCSTSVFWLDGVLDQLRDSEMIVQIVGTRTEVESVTTAGQADPR